MGPALVEEHGTGAERLQWGAVRRVPLRVYLPGREDGLPVTCEGGGNRYHIAGGLIVFCMLNNRVQHQLVFKIDRITIVFPA